jgi:hypothetical protein
LAAVGLILGVIQVAKSQWQSLSDWAIIVVAVAVLVLTVDPLK